MSFAASQAPLEQHLKTIFISSQKVRNGWKDFTVFPDIPTASAATQCKSIVTERHVDKVYEMTCIVPETPCKLCKFGEQ